MHRVQIVQMVRVGVIRRAASLGGVLLVELRGIRSGLLVFFCLPFCLPRLFLVFAVDGFARDMILVIPPRTYRALIALTPRSPPHEWSIRCLRGGEMHPKQTPDPKSGSKVDMSDCLEKADLVNGLWRAQDLTGVGIGVPQRTIIHPHLPYSLRSLFSLPTPSIWSR